MKQHKWSIEDDNWLINNYKNLGPDKSASELGLRKSQIENRVFKLNLKLPTEFKNSLQSIKPEKGSTLRQFTLASSYEQDWSYFEELCKEKNIKYNIKRTIGKKSSSSVIRITDEDGILKLGEYIYKDFHEDKIGLIRKYEKYKLIV